MPRRSEASLLTRPLTATPACKPPNLASRALTILGVLTLRVVGVGDDKLSPLDPPNVASSGCGEVSDYLPFQSAILAKYHLKLCPVSLSANHLEELPCVPWLGAKPLVALNFPPLGQGIVVLDLKIGFKLGVLMKLQKAILRTFPHIRREWVVVWLTPTLIICLKR
jgi:hypothetical protein